MKSKFIGAAIRAAAATSAIVFAVPSLAQDTTVPQADEIIEVLSAQEVAPAGVRIKGGGRGIQVQMTPVEPPSMDFKVEFELGSSELTPDAMTVLDQLGLALSSEALSPYDFKIAGHTDATGPETFNLQLSEQRARAVEDYLSARFGIDRDRLNTIGVGEGEPLDRGNPFSPQNRRVEITNIGSSGS